MRSEKLMAVLDNISQRYGPQTIRLATSLYRASGLVQGRVVVCCHLHRADRRPYVELHIRPKLSHTQCSGASIRAMSAAAVPPPDFPPDRDSKIPDYPT